MEKFELIYERACERKGGEKALMRLLPDFRSARALNATRDDRWLAEMTRCTFQAGFVWRVINQKWDDFEEIFFGFAPEKVLLLSPDQIDNIARNPRIVRNRQKVLCVQHNALYVRDVSREHGSFGRLVSGWPQEDLIGLFTHLKKHGSRLGGMTGQRVLRNMGRDTFILTGDVIRCLRRAGLEISDTPSSQRELRLAQDAFNTWHSETGLPLSHISRICACSVD
ncbi:DNA-3-methyladenine glycosylase I [Pseudohalioglobus sediminis]|uniref:DNA-3-methyladenine glycosylase I n=1 Tax=Pseudohalioglobus sediminis TaxID=2606449 RepID=A0A5B0WS55_9GAMM|nr:DNA-3-methyladenine glycosylase I [Pseudohalioglobus sediminis]KAA1189165.1 DNA-3-methyladenine glycosylase I [Pseudohalioglobus sediminis]